ncbi:MAG: hypothetical protein ACRELZ_03290 [Candidatus Rokuibacteriota bacterium]
MLGVALTYAFSPVRVVVEGMGTIEPVFEELALVTADKPGVITRVLVTPRQEVDRGTPLYEYLPAPWSVSTSSLNATTW